MWTQSQKERLKVLWRTGVQIKVIAYEIGKSQSAIKSMRKLMGLPTRRATNTTHMIRTNVSEEVYSAIRRRCIERGQTVSDYVRYLIKRDTGLG